MGAFFSIVTATYNAAPVLSCMLESLAAQTCRDFELVVQDGASQDASVSIVESYREKLPALSLVSEPDAGIYDAWNKALPRASGKWLLFLGADDFLLGPESLAGVRRLIENLPESIAFFGCSILIASENGCPVETINPASEPRKHLADGMTLPHTALLHRRDLFTNNNSFSLKFKVAGDYEFLCRTLTENNVVVSDFVISCMRVGGLSASPASMLRSEREYLAISRMFFPTAFRLGLYARMCRSLVFLAIDKTLGRKPALAFADFARRMKGKVPLWTRSQSAGILPGLPEKALVSLLIATWGREKQLQDLFESLNAQTYSNFEVLVADQNAPGFLGKVLESLDPKIPCKHILLPQCGVSHARNALLEQAQGDIIAFPDDDCRYLPNTLERVVAHFTRAPELGGLVVSWAERPFPSGVQERLEPVTRVNAFRRAGTLVQFYRKEALAGVTYDPLLGPGTNLPYGCGEDTDFLLQVLEKGHAVRRTGEILVGHPEPDIHDRTLDAKTYAYARGRMYLLRKHKFSLWFKLANIVYPLGCLFREGAKAWHYRRAMFRGRLKAFFDA